MQEYLGYYNVNKDEYNEIANLYAKKNGLTIDEELGHGQWGIAFSTESGDVIKVTADPAEVYNALQLINKNLKNVVDIYDIEIGDRLSVIKQEKLNNVGNDIIKNLYNKTLNKLNKADQCFFSLDFELLAEYGVVLSEEEESFAIDINNGINNMYDNKAYPEDIDIENIGINKNGDFVIFDQRAAYEDTQELILKLESSKIKEKHMSLEKIKHKNKI